VGREAFRGLEDGVGGAGSAARARRQQRRKVLNGQQRADGVEAKGSEERFGVELGWRALREQDSGQDEGEAKVMGARAIRRACGGEERGCFGGGGGDGRFVCGQSADEGA
jgi:hypothetical protein